MNTAEEYIFEQHLKNLNTKWEDFSREIKDIQTPDTFSILYAADIHYIRKYAMLVPAYYKVKEMVEFSKYVGFDLFALAGDIVDGNTTLKRQKRDLYDIMGLVREAKTTSVVISKGNHDDCSWYAYENGLGIEATISPELWYSYAVNPIRVQYPINIDENNIAGGYYYMDYPLHKIRVINLNTNDTPYVLNDDGTFKKEYCGQWCLGLSEKQLVWLSNVLKFTDEGWSVLIMSHSFLLEGISGNEKILNGKLAWEIILGYANRKKGTVKSSEKYCEATVSYDFTDNKSHDILPYFCGHSHRDEQLVQDNIVVVSTKNVLGNLHREWDKSDEKIDGSWDCILIDKKKRYVQIKRYGIENENRDIHF
ncbi:MAG: metallophosphoesterase [Firmicutes bacterium]|nr:metallophosphoesterase [Bacillota bacterium]